MIDSGFGYVLSVVQIKNRGLFDPTVTKNNSNWPNNTKAQE